MAIPWTKEDYEDFDEFEAKEGLWLSSIDEARELYRVGYISLREFDRLKGKYYNVKYNYPKDTGLSLGIVRHPSGHWVTYGEIYLKRPGEW